jgi:YVTN family beta-propeller protein
MPQSHLISAAGGRHQPRSRSALATLGFGAVLVLAACGPAPAATAPASDAPTPPATADAPLTGRWDGALEDHSGTYPVQLALDGCTTIGSVCGELEYIDPGRSDTVLCASELTLTDREGDRFAFSEAYVYHGWMCLPTTFVMTSGADGSLAVEQFGEDGVVCCRGTLAPLDTAAVPTPEVPGSIGAGLATSATALGGATTQYAASGGGSLWFPLEDLGGVARVDPATGALTALVVTGDPGALEGTKSDPHGVAAGEAGIWVAQAAARSVGRIDPATNAIAETVTLRVIPYALALDGTTLWATSFEDDRVVRVDLASRAVVAAIDVNKPTGIAVGLGGVWVVRHRDDVLVRIDPATNAVVAEIGLGDHGPSAVCGMCVENVVVSDGSVWTANNEGRSISRIDPATNAVTATIPVPLRPWSVSVGGGRIWASQFEAGPDGTFANLSGWGVARIDPATNAVTSLGLPGALGVFWAYEILWAVTPGRRGDVVIRIEPAAP